MCAIASSCYGQTEQLKIADVVNHKRCATPEAQPVAQAGEDALSVGNVALTQARKNIAVPKKPKAKGGKKAGGAASG